MRIGNLRAFSIHAQYSTHTSVPDKNARTNTIPPIQSQDGDAMHCSFYFSLILLAIIGQSKYQLQIRFRFQ